MVWYPTHGAASALPSVRWFCVRCSGRRTNKQGAYAGIIVGGVVDLVWAQLSGGIFDLYEIVPGFVFGLLAIVVVSLLTPAPTKAVTDEFDSYHHCVE